LGVDGVLAVASVAIASAGIVAAWRLFGVDLGALRWPDRPARVGELVRTLPGAASLYRASLNKWWFDDLNHLLFVVVGGRIAALLLWWDVRVVDGAVNGVAAVTLRTGDRLRRIQTGRVQNYALGIALGLVAMALLFLLAAPR
jgi:NAD(P)H-quinone oxidoreductase subunit 5